MSPVKFIDLLRAANRGATIHLMPADLCPGPRHITVVWKYHGTGQFVGEMLTYTHSFAPELFEHSRFPHRSVIYYIQLAAENMAKQGGRPDRNHELFTPLAKLLAYENERDHLEMSLNAGLISPSTYAEAMVVLIHRRSQEKSDE